MAVLFLLSKSIGTRTNQSPRSEDAPESAPGASIAHNALASNTLGTSTGPHPKQRHACESPGPHRSDLSATDGNSASLTTLVLYSQRCGVVTGRTTVGPNLPTCPLSVFSPLRKHAGKKLGVLQVIFCRMVIGEAIRNCGNRREDWLAGRWPHILGLSPGIPIELVCRQSYDRTYTAGKNTRAIHGQHTGLRFRGQAASVESFL